MFSLSDFFLLDKMTTEKVIDDESVKLIFINKNEKKKDNNQITDILEMYDWMFMIFLGFYMMFLFLILIFAVYNPTAIIPIFQIGTAITIMCSSVIDYYYFIKRKPQKPL